MACLALAMAVMAASAWGERVDAAPSLHLRGRVMGQVYPGVLTPMRVAVHNRSGGPVQVRGLRARAVRGAPGCPPANFTVRRRRLNLLVGRHRTRSVRLMVGLRSSAPDACQGVRFRLRLHARARAPRPLPRELSTVAATCWQRMRWW